MKPNVEIRIINTKDMPPIVISQSEDTITPKVVINTYHTLWLSLKRRTIVGIVEALQEKLDIILTSYLEEQLQFEQMDREE